MSIDGGYPLVHDGNMGNKTFSNRDTLTRSIRQLQHSLLSSDLNPYQTEYISTSLTSLESLITSLKEQYDSKDLPQDVFEQFSTLIVKFESLIIKASSRKSSFTSIQHPPSRYIDDTIEDGDVSMVGNRTNKSRTSSAFNSPVKHSFSRSSSISKPTITKENVLREPITSDSTDFLRFATPGLNQQLQGLFKAVDVRDLKGLQELSKSSDVFVD